MLTELQQREATIKEAVSWIPTPFLYSGSVKHIGCAGGPFLIACYRPYSEDEGRPWPNPPPFPKDWAFHTAEPRFQSIVESFCAEVDTPQPGDVALFRLGASTRPLSHGALVIEW